MGMEVGFGGWLLLVREADRDFPTLLCPSQWRRKRSKDRVSYRVKSEREKQVLYINAYM